MRVSELPVTKMPYRAKEPMPTFEHRFFVYRIASIPINIDWIGNLTIPIDTALDIHIHALIERLYNETSILR
jgi:hypothetical protein